MNISIRPEVIARAVRQANRHRATQTPPQPAVSACDRIITVDPEQLSESMTITITRDALKAIERTIGSRHAETGAVLGGSRSKGLITEVFFDKSAAVSRVTYTPDVAVVNRLLREEWDLNGIDFMGFVHSHPGGYSHPSNGDQAYAERILAALPKLDRLIMPVVQTIPDTGTYKIKGFTAIRAHAGRPRPRQDEHHAVKILPAPFVVVDNTKPHQAATRSPFWQRVEHAYDLNVMAATRIVAIGVGGSVGFLESMARSGIGEFVLIDPDDIEEKNIATQAVDPHDIGRPKVEALADRLTRLNPTCRVWTINAKESAIDDTGFHRLLRETLPDGPAKLPAVSLLCAFTDNFPAQDRIHRLGLHFGVPTISASVYAEGRGVEVSFAAPGVTPACLRCAQSSRYNAYANGYVNDVTSDGTPLLATDRLNTAKQIITLPLLHHISPAARNDHPATIRYRGWMERFHDRNLNITRLDPDSSIPSFAPLSAVADGRLIMDETVWTKPVPDGPDSPTGACPDCGGTGDLSNVIGTFADTRIMPLIYGEARRGSLAPNPVNV